MILYKLNRGPLVATAVAYLENDDCLHQGGTLFFQLVLEFPQIDAFLVLFQQLSVRLRQFH